VGPRLSVSVSISRDAVAAAALSTRTSGIAEAPKMLKRHPNAAKYMERKLVRPVRAAVSQVRSSVASQLPLRNKTHAARDANEIKEIL
jgi:hypothetical protein